MLDLVTSDTAPETVEAVRNAAREAIWTALARGKSGRQLLFSGNPDHLIIEWPGKTEPPNPTNGVWFADYYMGNDG
jgi:hypothetical protein